MEIRHLNYGTGNRVGEIIYLNKDLKKYPELYEAILQHEKKHSGRFSFFDFKHDLYNEELSGVKFQWWKFLIKHPKAWINFFPFMKIEGKWCVDISLLIIWIFVIGLSFFIYFNLP